MQNLYLLLLILIVILITISIVYTAIQFELLKKGKCYKVPAEKEKYNFLVVYEDMWNNKEYYKTNRIGDTISEILDGSDLRLDEDKDIDLSKLNSENPYDVGTFGLGFYDIDVYDIDSDEEDFSSNGKIMIFFIGDDDKEDEKEHYPVESKFPDDFEINVSLKNNSLIVSHENSTGVKSFVYSKDEMLKQIVKYIENNQTV